MMEIEQLTEPIKNPFFKRKLETEKFQNLASFGDDVEVNYLDWQWRGDNNANVKKDEK